MTQPTHAESYILPLPACRGRATKRRNGGSRNSNRKRLQRWTSSEHAQLEQLVLQYGTEKNWTTIAEGMPGRTGEMSGAAAAHTKASTGVLHHGTAACMSMPRQSPPTRLPYYICLHPDAQCLCAAALQASSAASAG